MFSVYWVYDPVLRRIRILETKVMRYENQTGGSLELTSKVYDPVSTPSEKETYMRSSSAYALPGVQAIYVS